MLGLLAPQLEGSMAPGRVRNSSKKAQQEPDYTVAGEGTSCAPEASLTGSWASRPAGHQVERTSLVPGVQQKAQGCRLRRPFLPSLFRASPGPSAQPASLPFTLVLLHHISLPHGRLLSFPLPA